MFHQKLLNPPSGILDGRREAELRPQAQDSVWAYRLTRRRMHVYSCQPIFGRIVTFPIRLQ
eukprot:2004821-Pyramimonas_sp.AAC.1